MPRTIIGACALAAAGIAAAGAQTRDAAIVLRDMRTALGGDAALDAVKTFSASGSLTRRSGGFSTGLSLEWSALLPDHFMQVLHDSQMAGPRPLDITYYSGFRGNVLIRRTDANIPFPPDPGPQTPEAIAKREAEMLLRNKQEFARLIGALLGTSLSSYPLVFSMVGTETVEGRMAEVVEGRSPDAFIARLYVESTTHLPMLIAWQAPQPAVITTSSTSTMVMRGGQVISQSPPTPPAAVPAPDAAGRPLVTWRLIISDFKLEHGLNWPRRLREMMGNQLTEETRISRFRINPKLDARTFDVGR